MKPESLSDKLYESLAVIGLREME